MSSDEALVTPGELSVSPAGKRRRLARLQLVLLLALGICGAFLGYRRWRSHESAKAENQNLTIGAATGAAGPKSGERPVVVQVAVAAVQDVSVILNGLGSVSAKRSALLRSRVSGQLVRVFFTEGELVKAGQLLAELDPRPFQAEVQRATGQLIRDRALLEHARADLERTRALQVASIANQEEVDLKTSLVRQYEGTLQVDEGLLSLTSLQLDYSRIVAPFAGRIGLRSLDPGNNVAPNDSTYIATIHAVQPIDVLFSLPEDQLPTVAKRLRDKASGSAKLVVEAWDKGSRNRIATGDLVALDNQVDPNTGTFKLKAEFSNDDGLLFPNQFVNVRLVVDTKVNAKVIPRAAIQHGTSGPYVFAVDNDQVARVKPIVLGAANGPVIVVEDGLAAGEVVVTSGTDRLRDGARVAPANDTQEVEVGASSGSKHEATSKAPAVTQVKPAKP